MRMYERLWGRGKLRLGLKRSLMVNDLARKVCACICVRVINDLRHMKCDLQHAAPRLLLLLALK